MMPKISIRENEFAMTIDREPIAYPYTAQRKMPDDSMTFAPREMSAV